MPSIEQVRWPELPSPRTGLERVPAQRDGRVHEVEGGQVFALHQMHCVLVEVGVGFDLLVGIAHLEGAVELARQVQAVVEPVFGDALGQG